ncbi:MAG TPA: TonB-dependent receptor [Blastocatellia bacterium]|nr:TonB-dependent receptor [Blastocatellia bacterium]
MKKMSKLGIQILLAVCLALSLSAVTQTFGQNVTGTIVGTVTDSNGAAVAGANVTIRDTDKNIVVRTVTTNSNGEYTATLLPVSHYSVTVEAANFKKFVKTGIELNVNDHLTIDAAMQVGQVNEEVTVQAASTEVELQTATSGTVVSNLEVKELPLNSRVYLQLLTLMPGVSNGSSDQLFIGTTNPSGQTNTVSFAINGGRTSENSYTVDGADNIDRGSNLTLLNTPSIDAIAEFRVTRNHYSAEYGRDAAGQVNVITKSGTSKFNGDAYEFFRNDALNANNFFNNLANVKRPPLRYNNFGYTIGGPLYIPGVYNDSKDKTFFFFSQEYHRIITYGTFTADVPTANERQGIFATKVCTGPITTVSPGVTTCPSSNTISNIDPIAAEYIKDIYSKLPLPNAGTTADPNRLITPVQSIFNHRQDLIRIDHNFNSKVSLSGRYLNDSIPTIEPGGLFTGDVLPGVATTKTNSPGRSLVLRSVQTFRPTFLNEIGYAFSYGAIISDTTGLEASVNSPDIQVTLPFKSTLNRVPGISNGMSAIAGFGPYRDFNRNHNIFDNVTKIVGAQTLKFGLSLNFYQKTENAAGNNVGTYAFSTSRSNDGTTAGTLAQQQGWANFLLGNVATFTQASEDITPDIRARQHEFYFQDDWRIKSNLTLNMGVRYSMFRQPIDKNGELTTFDPALYNPAHAVGIDASGNKLPCVSPCDPLNGIIIAGVNSPFGNKVGPENYKAFAPVFGFAWDPFKDSKTSIRGGYGLSYDTTLFGTLEQNIFANPPFVNNISISNTNFANPGSVLASVSAAPLTLHATPVDFQVPYIQQWSLDLQREIKKDFIVEVGYYGSKGTHLLGIVDLNEVPPGAAVAAGLAPAGTAVTAGAATNKLNQIRPFLGYVAINSLENWFNSNYNSMQMSVEKRFSAGSLIKAAYTWSHNLTDNQSDRSNAPQNVYDRASEYGPASFDRRHILTVDYVYELPFFRGAKGVEGLALSGWEISGITSYASGLPLTATTSGFDPAGLGFLGTSAAGGRPDQISDPNNAPGTLLQWFDKNAFALVPGTVHRPGDAGRGTILGPGFGRWDFSLAKFFTIKEDVKLQFRTEMFNAFNHTNFLNVSTSFTAGTFGQITSTHDPRIIQFGLKLYF